LEPPRAAGDVFFYAVWEIMPRQRGLPALRRTLRAGDAA
jgi:hypothetical protein